MDISITDGKTVLTQKPLEKMGEFFDARLACYEDHQLHEIEFAPEFLRFTAEQLPAEPNCKLLDLGCGTGLELDEYFRINASSEVTGIDLAPGMLDKLREKHGDKKLRLVTGSYLDIPFEPGYYDAAVSVESLHHFTAGEKIPLYRKLHGSLKENGYFILTDYFAATNEQEQLFRAEYEQLRKEQGIFDDELYHFDTPLTVEHEIECLLNAGFSSAQVLSGWAATYSIKAVR